MTPDLKFKIDYKADTKNAKYFVDQGEFVDWFLPSDLYHILDKKISRTERHKIISKYTKDFYQTNKTEITKGFETTKKRWKKIEKQFYAIANNIFENHPWPKGKYIGYASIYSMYPRDIKSKTFYFPYAKIKWDPIQTIAHEMLHFIFFDFIKNKYGIKENTEFKSKDPKYVWQISETFNTVIENWKPYKDLFNETKNVKPYPGCEKIYKKMRGQWNRNQNINQLLNKWLLEKNF